MESDQIVSDLEPAESDLAPLDKGLVEVASDVGEAASAGSEEEDQELNLDDLGDISGGARCSGPSKTAGS